MSAPERTLLSRAGRDELLRDLAAAGEAVDGLVARLSGSRGDAEEVLDGEFARARARVFALCQQYEDGLPRLPLSRCPFTGKLVDHSLDPLGLDGPWWNCEAPVRPVETLPATVFAFSGALAVSGTVSDLPFLCKPGPSVPFVVPRLIGRPEIRAVMSSVRVGPHTAWPIFYFADPVPRRILRVNDWGTNRYFASKEDGEGYMGSSHDVAEDFDYDLEPWLYAGKLLWIDPNDDTMTLQTARRHCPFAGLKGRREPVCIQGKRTWSSLIS